MKRIGFDTRSGSLVIMGGGVYPARSLMVSEETEGRFQIWSLAGRAEQMIGWDELMDLGGDTFASVEKARDYLDGEFAKELPRDVAKVTAVAGASAIAGMPLAVSRSDGMLMPARADTYALSFVAGLATHSCAEGYPEEATQTPLTLPDWTEITGTTALSVGQPYFLGPTGGLTTTPDMTQGLCLVRVGAAASSTTFVPNLSDPILL